MDVVSLRFESIYPDFYDEEACSAFKKLHIVFFEIVTFLWVNNNNE